MKILFICHRFPYPPNRGGKIRPFEMIRHLSRNHEVVVASLAHTEQELEQGSGLKNHCAQILAEVVPNRARWKRAGQALFSSMPSSAAYFSSARLAQRIQETWNGGKFDGVMLHCAFVAQYALPLQGGFRILDFGDLDSHKWAEYSEHRLFPLSIGFGLEAKKLSAYEKQVARTFDWCTFTTKGECEDFLKYQTNVPTTVIPNGVDATYFDTLAPPAPGSNVILFLGRMDYFPNIDGVCRFAATVFPLIRQRVPNSELRIVGANPNRAVRKLSEIPGVTVTGFVPDVRPMVKDAAVAVVPLRVARGTQNKILECMSLGIPVVSTATAAKGVQADPGRHLLVADEPAEFARRVTDILESPRLRQDLATAARGQVEQVHSWPSSMRILDEVIENAESRGAARESRRLALATQAF
jgi:sugar transferase (PEP-CTERM/EpsH1 system associated)